MQKLQNTNQRYISSGHPCVLRQEKNFYSIKQKKKKNFQDYLSKDFFLFSYYVTGTLFIFRGNNTNLGET